MMSSYFETASPTSLFYSLSLHDALPICGEGYVCSCRRRLRNSCFIHRGACLSANHYLCFPKNYRGQRCFFFRSEEHTSELQSRGHIVCRLLLEKKKSHISL